jgi:hypothetical protein
MLLLLMFEPRVPDNVLGLGILACAINTSVVHIDCGTSSRNPNKLTELSANSP